MPKLTIDPSVKQKCPRTALGSLIARVTADTTSVELAEEMTLRENEILNLPEPRVVLESSRIVSTRAGYKALGKDPARYRGSAEALLRRLLSGKGFPQINSVVDIINLVSVESRLPIGLYDLSKVQGDIAFRAGRTGESYKGIGKYDLNLEDLAVFCDEAGPHGSPTSDSERTMVNLATTHIAAILISFGGAEGLDVAGQRMSGLLQKYASGRDCHFEIIS
jgi:DNA/RNA-binding domain of Phe-tRNA-synthetase-like protein